MESIADKGSVQDGTGRIGEDWEREERNLRCSLFTLRLDFLWYPGHDSQ